jgi:hypothetical protein
MDNFESDPSTSTSKTFTSLEERQMERAMGLDDDFFGLREEDTDDNDIQSCQSDSDSENGDEFPPVRNIEFDDHHMELKEELDETNWRYENYQDDFQTIEIGNVQGNFCNIQGNSNVKDQCCQVRMNFCNIHW